MAAGGIMVIVELLAFFLAATLPKQALRAVRIKLLTLGVALLGFEAGTLYFTQVALVEASQAVARGQNTRIEELRHSISAQRAALATIQEAANRQSQSRHAWIREAAVAQASKAVHINAAVSAQAAELADLEARVVATTRDVLGKEGMIAYALARSLLLVLMGVVLFSVAGALIQARREQAAGGSLAAKKPCSTAVARTAGAPSHGGGRYAAVPLAFMSLLPSAIAQQVSVQSWTPQQPSIKEPQRAAPTGNVSAEVTENDAPPEEQRRVASVKDSGTGDDDGWRFVRVRADILAGKIKPSLRSIYAAHGATQVVASRYLAAMLAAGELKRSGKGYALV
ncbi:hypothetical protein A2G96_13125 [Cupriavidus nantongensis]|uniref:Uncharacterized protein n=2 Tax=Cupriavidus nantongensis TaxID=1796606 RepID=A0A142JKJ5_9BURK|nr:hypothetical protein A2G96_13125 [Cupriavidus nantongensis]